MPGEDRRKDVSAMFATTGLYAYELGGNLTVLSFIFIGAVAWVGVHPRARLYGPTTFQRD